MRKSNIADQLKAAAKASGQTTYALAKGSGLDRAAVVRWLNSTRDLRLENAAKMAEYLGLELRPIAKGGK